MLDRLLIALMLAALAAAPRAAEPELLEPDQAFRFSARALSPDSLEVRYQIAPGYYLYRDKFQFSAEPASVRLGAPELPPGKVKHDQFFGAVQIYRGEVRIRVPVTAAAGGSTTLAAISQGCADVGVCYVPHEQKTKLRLAAMGGDVPRPGAAVPAESASAATTASSLFPEDQAGAPRALLPGAPMEAADRSPRPSQSGAAADVPQPSAPASRAQGEDGIIAALFKGEVALLVLSFFGFGLLLSFTPCVLPMIPILSGIIVGRGSAADRGHGFMLSVSYVLGMALTYAAAGVLAGLSGAMLSSAFQNPWVIGSFALLFILLSLSMFGLYELQLPSRVQTRLASLTNRLPGGRLTGVFAMGALSALIVGPCVAAPLAGALLYISQSRDVVLGGSALFAMALGMGVPLLAIGASAGALLPKAGPWMASVKRFFGVVLLGVAIYLAAPLVPRVVEMLAWSALLMLSGVFMRAIDPLPSGARGFDRLAKGVGLIALVTGVAVLIGVLAGGRDVLQPLASLRAGAGDAAGVQPAGFVSVNSNAQLDAAIASARGRPVMLDFYADWCVSCKEMERFTFTDREVRSRLRDMVLLRADVTPNTADHQRLLQRFRLFGPPGIIFFDSRGAEIEALRVIGFRAAPQFAHVLDQVLAVERNAP